MLADPAFKLCESASVQLFNKAEEEILKGVEIHSLDTQYKRALYAFRNDMGQAQYPDANATMRLTFGTTGPLMPQDGITYSWYSTVQGILDKWNPDDYEFQSNPRMLQFLKNPDWGRWADKKDGSMHVNFICDLDITGGNSGSPVLDEKGRLIGLAFDGNKESLGADTFFHKDLNKCVCVDIRYVLWIIEKYAQADYLLDEMNLIFLTFLIITVMTKYECNLCGYVYDPAKGDPENGIAPGTAFHDIPDDWVCPLCGATKDNFSPL